MPRRDGLSRLLSSAWSNLTRRRSVHSTTPLFELTPLERRQFMDATNTTLSDHRWDDPPEAADTGIAWTGGSVEYKVDLLTGEDSGDGYRSGMSFTLDGGSSLPTGTYTLKFDLLIIDDGPSQFAENNPPPGTYKIEVTGSSLEGPTEGPLFPDEDSVPPAQNINDDEQGLVTDDAPPEPFSYFYTIADYALGKSITFDYVQGQSLSITVSVSGLDSSHGATGGLDNALLSYTASAQSCTLKNGGAGGPKVPVYGPNGGGGAPGGGGGVGGLPGGGGTWRGGAEGTLGGDLGNNVFMDGHSFVAREGSGAVAIYNGASTQWFDLRDDGSYAARYGVIGVFTQDAGTHEYIVSDGDGTVTRYYDFDSSINAALRGKVKSVTDAGGNVTSYSYNGTTHLVEEVTHSATVGTVTTKESLLYSRLSGGDPNAGKISSITLRRKTWDTSLSQTEGSVSFVTLRSTDYTYYGSSDSNGNLGDLKLTVLKDASGNAIDTSYYRYYTSGNFDGGVKYVLGPASYARALAGLTGGVTPLTASDSQLATYADNYYEYDEYHRVSLQTAQGEGCSACSGGQGTYTYNYVRSGNNGGANSWSLRTIESLPDGSQYVYYYDDSGQEMLRVFQQMDDAKSISGITHSGVTATVTSNAHGYSLGDVVHVRGAAQKEYNGLFTITAVTTNTFSYVMAASPASNATGTPLTVSRVAMQWGTFTKYDDEGHAILVAQPSAVALPANITTLEQYGDLLNDDGTGDYQYLNDSAGRIDLTDYYDENGSAPGYVQDVKVQQGDTGTAILTEAWDYTTQTSGDVTVYRVASDTRYRNDDGSDGQVTTYAYTWDGLRVESMTVDLPLIDGSQNGPDSADETVTFYDVDGRPTWTKDADGYVTYTVYDRATGAVLKSITDVDYSSLSASDKLSFDATTWSQPSGGLHLVTSYQVDSLGRTTKVTDPNGNMTFIVYNDAGHETRTYQGSMSGTNFVRVGPTMVQREDRAGSYVEALTLTTSPSLTGGVPNGTETITAAGIATLSRTHRSTGGQVDESDKYFQLTSGTSSATYSQGANSFQLGGTSGANLYYYATTFGYDKRGRQNRIVNPVGTITRTVYDGFGRATSTWIGTNDTPVSGFWSTTNAAGMTDVADYFYDAHDGTQGIGDGNLTRVVRHSDQFHADRNVEYFYDWRGRMVAQKDGLKLTSGAINTAGEDTGTHRIIKYNTYDNLDQLTQQDTYAADQVGITTTDGVPDAPTSSKLRARVTYDHDDQGRRYRTTLSSVDSSGNVGTNTLSTNTFYDHRGNVIEIASPDAPVTKRLYDGANRVVKEYHTDGGSGTDWTAATTVSSDQVLSQAEYTYDANGNVILVTTRQHFHDDTNTGELGDAATGALARVSFQAFWYDKANRLTDSVDVGTNGGTSYARDPAPPGATNRSDTLLLTHQDYNSAGWADTVTDPRAIVAKSVYDMLGRTRRTVSAWDGNTNAISLTASLGSVAGSASNQITDYTYDGSNHTLTQTAWNKSGTNTATSQTTQYVYGVNTGQNGNYVNSNDLLYQVRYPDASTGGASTNAASVVTYGYNKQADAIRKTDQNGTLFIYSYDVLGRNSDAGQVDVSATVASGNPQNVDTAVVELATYYDDAGRAYLFTSYNGSSVVQNQVERLFNGFGQLVTEYQEHSGGVTGGSSLKVQYVYDQTNGHSRLSQVIYPNGRILHYGYNSGTDDAVSRVSFLADDDGSGGEGTHLEDYSYLGEGAIVIAAHGETGVDLTYVKQSGESDGDAGDQYIGLDRFGRVADQRYINSSTSTQTDRFQYGYDRNSNVLYKNNLLSSTNSELYHTNGASAGYDLLNRLTDFRRGTLSDANSDGVLDTVSTTNRTQSWSLDSLGNWDGANAVKTNNTAQSRTTNAKNEVTAVGGNTLTFDNDGNTTTDETGKKFVYDAWNRLVTVKNSSNVTLSSYKYDALGRKISENPGTQTDIYYGGQNDWQDLEERQGGATKSQNVWSQTYIDDLVLRDRNADSNTGTGSLGKSSSGLEERLYAQHDANHNVTAITDTSGTVQERFLYDPYGSSSVLTSAWASTTDTKAWAFRFQGGRLDGTSGFEDFRNRQYSPTLGRWVQQDPAGYVDGSNRYQHNRSNPTVLTDPLGLNPDVQLPPVDFTGKVTLDLDAKNGEFWRLFATGPNWGKITPEGRWESVDDDTVEWQGALPIEFLKELVVDRKKLPDCVAVDKLKQAVKDFNELTKAHEERAQKEFESFLSKPFKGSAADAEKSFVEFRRRTFAPDARWEIEEAVPMLRALSDALSPCNCDKNKAPHPALDKLNDTLKDWEKKLAALGKPK